MKAEDRSTRPAPQPHGVVIPDKEWRNRERANLLAALQQAHFRVSGSGGAADLLGINPGTLASRLKALGIDRRDSMTQVTTPVRPADRSPLDRG
jgi:transcriptional regulator with GAF, ATPase, and Fis domain